MLLLFAVAHYVQLIWTYGLGVPSGLFVPSLLGGASFGRLIGQALQGSAYIYASPGIYALVGATAMLSGMARITIPLCAILMQTTGEAEWAFRLSSPLWWPSGWQIVSTEASMSQARGPR